jgi:hypothetical protein
VYVVVYARGVRRTNIYLSEAEQRALDAQAAVEGCSRSEVVRGLIDREMHLGRDDEVDACLAGVAAELADRARRSSSSDPDLRIE